MHVLPCQLVRLIKEELLYNCLVWVELLDLPSFLWGSLKEIETSLGKVLFSPSINASNRNRICELWKADESFPKTLEIDIGVGTIIIDLKWGTLSGASYHCDNPRRYTRNFPTLSESQSPMIPTFPCSKNMVLVEQVFGKMRSTTNTGTPLTHKRIILLLNLLLLPKSLPLLWLIDFLLLLFHCKRIGP